MHGRLGAVRTTAVPPMLRRGKRHGEACMRKPGVQVLAWGSASVWVMAAVVACGHPESAANGAARSASQDSFRDSSTYTSELQKSDLPWSGSPSPYDAEVRLDDGRRVAMHYRRGQGLVEQHYSPRAKAWTHAVVIHRTELDACQGIELRANGGTVAAIADFGPYCYDGEPPAVSTASPSGTSTSRRISTVGSRPLSPTTGVRSSSGGTSPSVGAVPTGSAISDGPSAQRRDRPHLRPVGARGPVGWSGGRSGRSWGWPGARRRRVRG